MPSSSYTQIVWLEKEKNGYYGPMKQYALV